jgi:hypothetical protein
MPVSFSLLHVHFEETLILINELTASWIYPDFLFFHKRIHCNKLTERFHYIFHTSKHVKLQNFQISVIFTCNSKLHGWILLLECGLGTCSMCNVHVSTVTIHLCIDSTVFLISINNTVCCCIVSGTLHCCFSEQCHNLISATYKTSCKTGQGVEEMFADIAHQLVESNRSRLELQAMDKESFKVTPPDEATEPTCLC